MSSDDQNAAPSVELVSSGGSALTVNTNPKKRERRLRRRQLEGWVYTSHQFYDAVELASQRHANQRRKNQELLPLINHPIEVMGILSRQLPADYPMLLPLLIAAVLHDTLAHGQPKMPSEVIGARFGPLVERLVAEMTPSDSEIPLWERKLQQLESAASCTDELLILLKLADLQADLISLRRDGQPADWTVSQTSGFALWCVAMARAFPQVPHSSALRSAIEEQATRLRKDELNLEDHELPDSPEKWQLAKESYCALLRQRSMRRQSSLHSYPPIPPYKVEIE